MPAPARASHDELQEGAGANANASAGGEKVTSGLVNACQNCDPLAHRHERGRGDPGETGGNPLVGRPGSSPWRSHFQ